MDQSKIDMIVGSNIEYFEPQHLMLVREKLSQLDDSAAFMLQGSEYQKPSTILLIAILLGWERFWLDDVGLGVLKLLTGYGCGVWWLIDIFTATSRAKQYNFKKFMSVANLCQSR